MKLLFIILSYLAATAKATDSSSSSSSLSGSNPTSDSAVARLETEAAVLINVKTQSCDLTEFEYVFLEDLFIETYNDLAARKCSSDAPYVAAATIDRDGSSVLTCRVAVEGTSLFYPQGDGYSCPDLTEEAFASAYSEAIQSRNEDDPGSCVENVNAVIEMRLTPCPGNSSDFQADVVVTFIGDPTLSTAAQLDALEQSFVQTYNAINRLNPETCDPLFRLIQDATVIEESGFNRRLDNADESQVEHRLLQARTRFSYPYRITGKCRGCGPNSRLFAQGSSGRKRLLEESSIISHDIDRHLQEDCMCPVAAKEQRAPTDDEFLTAYQTAVSALQQANVIDSEFIASVVDVREVDEIECGSPNTFDTQVLVELVGDPQSVTEEEVGILEQSFGNSFKELAADFCDPFFRIPVDITIDTSTARRRHSRLLQARSVFSYLYDVEVNCRGCESNSRLFGDAVVGRILHVLKHGHRFQQADECFCSLEVIDDRSPSTGEFAVAYNDTVKDLNLPNIDYVLSVVELDGDTRVEDDSEESRSKRQGSGTKKSKASKKSTKSSKMKSTKSSKMSSQSKVSGR